MTGGTLAWGIAFAALCVITGILIGWPIGHARGLKHGTEETGWQREDARWVRDYRAATGPPAPPEVSRSAVPRGQSHYQPGDFRPPPRDTAGPGKHRHPAGPPRHAELPAAGYLPAPGPWDGTITVPAPAQLPPWEAPPPEPQAQVLEPTAADCLRPDALTDTGWTRQEARRLAREMDRDIERMEQDTTAWIAEHITATDPVLKEITR